jgi:glycosyltransferase involved in cell wall biosynthesis
LNDASTPRVIALLPSLDLGGGIESYARAVLGSLEASGAQVRRLVLATTPGRPSIRRKASFIREALVATREHSPGQAIVIAFHPSFTGLVGLMLRASDSQGTGFVVHHGWESWRSRPVRDRLTARSRIRLVAASTHTAGALAHVGNAQVLNPGIPRDRFDRLIRLARPTEQPWTILSVFRLPQFRGKGGPELIEACLRVRDEGREAKLVIAGRGPAPTDLRERAKEHAWIEVVESPTDAQLDQLFGRGDLLVLGTRSHASKGTGEGFGIVLVEAALAGLPLVAPAFGGARDAYLEGLSGLRPRDESPQELASVLRWFADNQDRAGRMGENARRWAKTRFDPDAYDHEVASVFLGRDHVPSMPIVLEELP